MAAYVIAQINITDPKIYEDYKALVPATIAAFGGEFVVRGGEQQALEGAAPSERTVVLRFPDMAAARAWYQSPAYQEARKHRFLNLTPFRKNVNSRRKRSPKHQYFQSKAKIFAFRSTRARVV